MNPNLADITTLGEDTRHRGIKAQDAKLRSWLEGLATCGMLEEYGLLHLGVVEACEPYRFVRPNLSATTFLACLGGQGRVLVDGEWVTCSAGSAVLLLPYTATAYYALGKEAWTLVWVCYQKRDGIEPVATVSSPALASYDGLPIFHAVEGLRNECEGANDPVCLRHWADLIQRLVIRYAEPWQREDRLHQVWEKVAADLGTAWTLDLLARNAYCSAEHLRRLCQQTLGRSPMEHVTHLRLQRATDRLVSSADKVEAIANEVGYRDPFAFSSMFKKWIGCPPTEYRQRRAGSGAR